MPVSVLTLTRDRTAHLVRQVEGLARSDVPPRELVVAVMGGQDPAAHLPQAPFPIRTVRLDDVQQEALPLARARNRATAEARHEHLVFLDADCIPAAGLVGAYGEALARRDAVFMGQVRYLPPDAAPADWTEATLRADALPQPGRPTPPPEGDRDESRYAHFRSLAFAVRRSTFERVGGFDAGFGGYGAEGTDFAFRLREHGVPLAWLAGAEAFHQHHPGHEPPVQHLESIVRNARTFHARWGSWPMADWLHAFERFGLVAWDPSGDRLDLVRTPTRAERAATLRTAVVPGRA